MTSSHTDLIWPADEEFCAEHCLYPPPVSKMPKKLVSSYKKGEVKVMTPEIWQAKKVVDSTLHPGMKQRGLRSTEGLTDPVQTLASRSSCLSECHAS